MEQLEINEGIRQMDVNHCSIQTIMKGGVKYKTNSYQFEISSSSGSRELQNFYMIILHKLKPESYCGLDCTFRHLIIIYVFQVCKNTQ